MVVSDLTVSTLNILFTLGIAELIRLEFLDYDKNSVLFRGGQELVSVIELCVVISELGIVLSAKGKLIFAIYVFLAFCWWNLRWTNASAGPFQVIDDYLLGAREMNGVSMIAIALASICGGMVYYNPFLYRSWMLWYRSPAGLGPIHQARLLNPMSCSTSIKVKVFYAGFIEGAGVLMLRLLSNVLGHETFRTWNAYIVAAIKAAATTACILGALNYTGGFFNPILATATQYGCTGATGLDQALVYCVSPLIGSLVTHIIWNHTGFRDLFSTKTD